MGKKGVLSTLKFILFTVVSILMIFSAVYFTVLNTYKPAVKAYINGEFIGYFSNEQQFDEVYNDLVTEKQNIDENVKVYLESEPTFEQSYIRDSLLEEQNVYTNLRAEIKTEYTIYEVKVGNTSKKIVRQVVVFDLDSLINVTSNAKEAVIKINTNSYFQYTVLPNKVVASKSNIQRLYKEASQSILNYLTGKNAGLHEIMRAENHAENIRLKKQYYLKRIGVLEDDDEIVRLI